MCRSRKLNYVVAILSLSLVILIVNWPFVNRPSPKYTQPIQQRPEFQPNSPSLNQIFVNDHGWTATLSADFVSPKADSVQPKAEKLTTLVATGDVMLGRTVNYKAVNAKNFNWPFEKTADVLKAADITFVNLEAPLVENCPVTNEGMIFCADTRHANGLAFAGVDLASMANNHAKNYGIEGINTTSNVLSKNSILTVGTSGAVIKNVKGVNFAFLAYNDVTQKQVETATLHAVGNHPHWIQPIEFYRKKPILYSQGNFVFDQMWSEKTRIGIVARFVFYNTTLIDIELFPIKIYNYGQPHFLVGDEKGMILAQLEKESATLSVYRR